MPVPPVRTQTERRLLRAGREPVLDVRNPALDLSHVEVRVSGKVLANGRVSVSQGAVKGSATQTDHHGDEAEQEEQEAGVSAAHLCMETKTQEGSHIQPPADDAVKLWPAGHIWTAVSFYLADGLIQC